MCIFRFLLVNSMSWGTMWLMCWKRWRTWRNAVSWRFKTSDGQYHIWLTLACQRILCNPLIPVVLPAYFTAYFTNRLNIVIPVPLCAPCMSLLHIHAPEHAWYIVPPCYPNGILCSKTAGVSVKLRLLFASITDKVYAASLTRNKTFRMSVQRIENSMPVLPWRKKNKSDFSIILFLYFVEKKVHNAVDMICPLWFLYIWCGS